MQTIGFIGAGQMARALAQGFVRAGLVSAEQITAADPSDAALNQFVADIPGSQAVTDNPQVAAGCQTLLLAVKPQHMAEVLAELKGHVGGDQLVVSIAAGVRLATIEKHLPAGRLIRVMPNTPCLVGRSAAGYCLGRGATQADGQWVENLFSAVGLAFRLEEKLLDAVTGLSGSGPAFVFQVIEALADGGVSMGLPRSTALALAAQTVCGAAEMVLQSGEHPAVLKDRVASPGGTTMAGLASLEKAGLRGALIDAVAAATQRSVELGEPS